MSFDNPFGDFGAGMGGFMPNMLQDIMKMMQSQDPTQFELISQLALSISADPGEGNVDPVDRVETEELTRIAELHVADVTGMTITPSGHPITVHALGRTAWVQRSLARWRPILAEIVRAQTSTITPGTALTDLALPNDPEEGAEMAQMMQRWLAMISPTLVAMQIGSAIGHLTQRALGQYDLLLPGDFSDGPGAIINNRKAFANDWSLPEKDVALWMTVNDISIHSVLSRPHVGQRLHDLVVAHASSLSIDQNALQQQLGSVMPTNMSELAELLGESGALGGAEQSFEMQQKQRELETLVTVIRGYADWVTKTVSERAIGARSLIAEATSRARMERSETERSADVLVGVEHGPEMFERGRRFVQGIIDRNGEQSLARLWVVESNLPTPAEIDAPGLWIERINL
jgi:putative hydrolase